MAAGSEAAGEFVGGEITSFLSLVSIGRFYQACRTISRFLYLTLLKGEAATIPLGRKLLSGSCNLPGSRNGAGRSCSPIWSCSAWGLPCQRPLPEPRCALTAPFHPYLTRDSSLSLESRPGGIVFCGTFRKTRFERAPPAVSRHVALWRPDFPPAAQFSRNGERLSVRQARVHYRLNIRETQMTSGVSAVYSCILLIQAV